MLAGGLVAIFYFPRNIGNFIIPIDELIFFRRGGPTTNQYMDSPACADFSGIFAGFPHGENSARSKVI